MNRKTRKKLPAAEMLPPENEIRPGGPFGNLALPLTAGERYVLLSGRVAELRRLMLESVPKDILDEYDSSLLALHNLESSRRNLDEEYLDLQEYQTMIGEFVREENARLRAKAAERKDPSGDPSAK